MQVGATGFAQRVTLSEKGTTFTKLFIKIKSQTGYDFVVSDAALKGLKPINVQVKNEELKVVLDKIFENQPLEYAIEDKSVVVSKKDASLLETLKKFIDGHTGEGRYLQDSTLYRGRVLDEKGEPLVGASVFLKGATKMSVSASNGKFQRYGTRRSIMVVKYIGYQTQEIPMRDLNPSEEIIVKMIPGSNDLGEVAIISNGYQNIPKERATGSFEVITAKQLQHSNDPNLLRRLEGITTSTVFNNTNIVTNSAQLSVYGGASNASVVGQFSNSPLTNLTIRGSNTLPDSRSTDIDNQSGIPLVIINGIASPYSIDLINPDDVETITILRDAAAASVWGSRAANGVIVIKTKSGGYSNKLNIAFNSNVTVTDKIDLFYKKRMSVSDYIDAQQYAYTVTNPVNPIPNPTLTNPGNLVRSPVAEILNDYRLGLINLSVRDSMLNSLRGNDIRNDYNKYIFRNAVNQNYNLNLSGGSKAFSYSVSGGYNNVINNTISNNSNKKNLNSTLNWKPLQNIEFFGIITYIQQNTSAQAAQNLVSGNTNNTFYPYTRLTDVQGNPASITKIYRPKFLDLLETNYGNKILSLDYKPLDDLHEGYQKLRVENVNLNFGVNLKINEWLNSNVTYNSNLGYTQETTYLSANSFYMRNLINLFTDRNSFVRNIPLGGGYSPTLINNQNNALRGQLNVNKTWNEVHNLSAVAGVDVSQNYSYRRIDSYYGYNPNTLEYNNRINYLDQLPLLFAEGGFTSIKQIPSFQYPPAITDYRIRTIGVYSNAAYAYKSKYVLSASIRKDGSSEFGVGTNKTGTPFYSVGAAWNISNEPFFKMNWIQYLKLRSSFGYNGNVNSLVVGSPRISLSTEPVFTGYYTATLEGGTVVNKELRPEKTGILNIALDFGILGDRLNGSIDYYRKRTTDLIAPNAVNPTLGYENARYNSANIKGNGFDLSLSSLNLKSGRFFWTSNFLLSHNRSKVTKVYKPKAITVGDVVGNSQFYDVGYDLNGLFAFEWAGLDPRTGDPRGYVDGQIVTLSVDAAGSANYIKILNSPITEAKYMGARVPTYFGSFRNTFTYGKLAISANLIYKLDYVFNRPAADVVTYGGLFGIGTNAQQGEEYARRWQKPGDELVTNVPSLAYFRTVGYRDQFYANSSINVLKGDHIRLQEIIFSYAFTPKKISAIKNYRVYANINNLGVIWRANRLGLDPDINGYPTPRSYSLGFSANF